MLKFFTKEVIKLFPVPEYIVFNVQNFNAWFNSPNNNAVYANPGIFLRLDKFGLAHVTDYLEKCYGITSTDGDVLLKFKNAIIEDWKIKSDLKNGL